MKNLFFKELKLSVHPLCYVFCLIFGFLGLVPNYPPFVAPIYVFAAYTFLFLGANKGQTTNDLFYTCNLPVRKQDVVAARVVSINFLKLLLFVPLVITLLIRNFYILPNLQDMPPIPGLDITQGFAFFGFIFVCMAITDFIYLTLFYRTGRSVVLPTLLGIIIFSTLAAFTTMALPEVGNFKEMVTIGGPNENIALEIGLFAGGIIISAAIEYGAYVVSKNELNKLDF